MQGFLWKYVNFIKKYEYRFFATDDIIGCLKYYRTPEEVKTDSPRATLKLAGASILLDSDDECHFVVNCIEKRLYLKAQNVSDRDEWILHLQKIILQHTRMSEKQFGGASSLVETENLEANGTYPKTSGTKIEDNHRSFDRNATEKLQYAIKDLGNLLERSSEVAAEISQNRRGLYEKLNDMKSEIKMLNENLEKLANQAAERTKAVENNTNQEFQDETSHATYAMDNNKVYCTRMEVVIDEALDHNLSILLPRIVRLLNLGKPLGARQLTKELDNLSKIQAQRGNSEQMLKYKDVKDCLNILCQKGLIKYNDFLRKYESCVKACTMITFIINN